MVVVLLGFLCLGAFGLFEPAPLSPLYVYDMARHERADKKTRKVEDEGLFVACGLWLAFGFLAK